MYSKKKNAPKAAASLILAVTILELEVSNMSTTVKEESIDIDDGGEVDPVSYNVMSPLLQLL